MIAVSRQSVLSRQFVLAKLTSRQSNVPVRQSTVLASVTKPNPQFVVIYVHKGKAKATQGTLSCTRR